MIIENKNDIFYKNNKFIWDQIWDNDIYATKKLRKLKAKSKVDLLFKHIIPKKDWNVVDLGCGSGYISEEIYNRVNCKLIGIDFSKNALEIAKSRLENLPIEFIEADVCNTGLIENSIDLVICCGIIEHVFYETKIINEIKRILKHNGYIFITTSNMVSFIWPQRFIKQWLKIWPYGYQKNWTIKGIKKLLKSHNLKIFFSEIVIDIGDYTMLGFIDRILAKFYKYFGRYIVLWGVKKNE